MAICRVLLLPSVLPRAPRTAGLYYMFYMRLKEALAGEGRPQVQGRWPPARHGGSGREAGAVRVHMQVGSMPAPIAFSR